MEKIIDILNLKNEPLLQVHLYNWSNDFTEAGKCINKIVNGEKDYIPTAILHYKRITLHINYLEYLLLDANPEIPRDTYIESYFNLGTLLKEFIENIVNDRHHLLKMNNANRKDNTCLELTESEMLIFNQSIECFYNILRIDFEHVNSKKQLLSIYSLLSLFMGSDTIKALKYMQQALLVEPENNSVHYNLGYLYQRLNNLENALIHFKTSIKLSDCLAEADLQLCKASKEIKVNSLNGLSAIYRGIKRWPESLHYLLKAENEIPGDPDINNQLGVVYTEMRRTDLAEECYIKAIQNVDKSFISSDKKFLLSEIYLNFGHCYSYNGDNEKSIDCYNKSLENCPNFSLPFQNKLMNLCYLFDQLDNKMYITRQHKIINKLYQKNPNPYNFNSSYFNVNKINIGIVSGDFVNHPVSYFISTFLTNFDHTKFNVICYSENVINTNIFNRHLLFKIIKGKSTKEASDIIYNDNIHILIDLSGHSGQNRLDIFAFKPSPISISYIGYPFTTGLNEINYRITDSICDGDLSISQQFYTEKLITLPNAFMCYNYQGLDNNKLPDITVSPKYINPNELIIGCFNRLNKITDTVIIEYNKILLECPNVKILFKTKALINLRIRKEFLNKFDETVRNRIIVINCVLSHTQHLDTYNKMDIAIDTWPYSGTTTTCEALSMGCPVFSIYDSKYFFHATNVSCSILKNSNLDFYVCNNTKEIINKIKILDNKPIEFWKTLKEDTRNKFLNGGFCNKDLYMTNIQKLFTDLFEKHKSSDPDS